MITAALFSATVCLCLLVFMAPLSYADHSFFHNYPHDSNFTTERAQYALERKVLKDFYFKTNPGLFGSHNKRDWISADKWMSKDMSHCLWEGITCTKNASVIRIFLPDNNLHGNIPKSITKLPELRQLWLFGNNLGPSIPHYLGDITKLELLFLQNNRYEGDVQPSLAKLQHLKVLDLSGMQLGERLARINDTTGYIGARGIEFGDIELTGIPEEYSAFQKLEDLDLSFNLLHGTIPSSLGNVNSLKKLYLSSNRLNGTIPESFASMSALEMLAFDLNVGMCSNTTAPHPPEHIGILPGTIYPNTCPVSKGPDNAMLDDMAPPGDEVLWDDPNNHRHPMDKGIGDVTYCGPHAFPLPIPCAYETLVPEAVRSHDNLTIQWVYPSAGTIATRDGVPDIAEQTRYERREHREAGYPFEWLPLEWEGKADELASAAGLDGLVNMWNDNQRPYGYRMT